MQGSSTIQSLRETPGRTRRSSSFKRRPLPSQVVGVPREFVARLEALVRDDCLQNICEVTQDPSEVEETFPFLPTTGSVFDRWSPSSSTDKEILAKGQKQTQLYQYLKTLKLSDWKSADVKSLEDTCIPTMYSEQQFNLRDVLNVMEKEGDLYSEALLRKKDELSMYLTEVQSLLSTNILAKSEAFSESIAEVEQVRKALAIVSKQVGDIRSQIQQVNNSFCDKMNDIHQTFEALKVGKVVLEKLEQVAELVEAPKHVSLLLGSSDYLGAVQAIEQLRDTRRDKFQNIRCLDFVERQLKTTLDDTIQIMRQDFVTCLDELIDEWTTQETPQDLSLEDCLKQDIHTLTTAASHSVLNSLIMAAFRFHKLQYLVRYYMDRYFDLFLENTSHIGEQTNSNRDLETKRTLVESLLTSCKWHIYRVALVVGLVDQLTINSTFSDSDVLATDASWKQMQVRFCENISERLYEACSLILSNIAQEADNNFRKDHWVEEQLISLQQFSLLCRDLEDLSHLLCNIFHVSQSTVGGLRTLMLDSIRSYLDTIHHVGYKAMEVFLKEERWNAIENIPEDVVLYLEEIRKIPSSVYSPRVWINGESVHSVPPRKDFIQLEESGKEESNIETSNGADEQEKTVCSIVRTPNSDKSFLLSLENSRCFPLTKSNLFLIKLLYLYVQCMVHLPRGFVDRDVVQKLVQIVRMVNQLTSRMVLAAGAIQTAGLKSISAKHLAIAYQSIQLLSQYMDWLLNAISTLVTVDQHNLAEFQKAQRDLRDHQGQILAKLVSIMNERMTYHQKTLESMPWNNDQLLQQWEIPSPYIQSIVRELFILDRVFSSCGMEREWKDLSIRIISSYGDKLTNIYESMKSIATAGRKRIAADIEFFLDNLVNMFGKEKLVSLGLKNLQQVQHTLGVGM